MTETDIANYGLAKVGGGGDQESGSGFISDINATDSPLAAKCRTLFPVCRGRVISDLAKLKCPFRETVKYADLGAKVTGTTLPEIEQWDYAFNLPGNCLAVVEQILESTGASNYNFEMILNAQDNGKLFLTDDLTNYDENSAYIQYCIDQPNTATWSFPFIECVATILAAELCPLIGKDVKMRMQLLIEYKTVCIPDAQVFNQSQGKNYAKVVPNNYLGGRG